MPRNAPGSYGALLVAAIIGPLLLFTAIAWWTWDRVQREATDDINRVSDLLLEQGVRLLQADALVLDRIDDRVAGLDWAAVAQREEELSAFLKSAPAALDGVDEVFLIDAQGEPQVASGHFPVAVRGAPVPTAANVSDRPYFKAAMTRPGLALDATLLSRLDGTPVINVARRLSSSDGTFRGIAVIAMSRDFLANSWRSIVTPGDTVSLVRDDGIVLARFPETALVPDKEPPRFSAETMAQLRVSDRGILETVSAIDGIARLDGYRKIPGYPIHVVYAIDRRNLSWNWYPTVAAFGALAIAAAVGLLLTGLAVIRRARGEAEALARAENAAAELLDSKTQYEALFRKAPVSMLALDLNGRLLDANEEWLSALGYTLDEAIGRSIRDFHPPGSEPQHSERWRQVLDSGGVRNAERPYVRKSGDVMETLLSAILERDAAGHSVRVITCAIDVTARRRAEESAKRERQLSELLIDSSTEGIIGIDREMRYTVWNPYMEAISGIPRQQVVGRMTFEVFPHLRGNAIDDGWRAALAGKRSSLREWPYAFQQSGRSGFFDREFAPLLAENQAIIGAISFLRDITDRRRMEETLRQAQKMEVVGQLTGGIAHDFNNLLTVIIGNIETLRRSVTTGTGDIHRMIEGAMRGATRAATLTQRLLAFSRRQPLDPQPVNLNKLVTTTSELLRRTIGEHIAIETVLAGGLWWVSADASQIENALLNLAVNARDAMPDGGKLTIETTNSYLDEAYAGIHEEVVPGQYTLLAVTDTGCGMTKEVLSKAFEPFFTTKGVGQGTGLGLSQVYGFVKQSGGHLKIYSEPGHGTTVKIYLPRLPAAEQGKDADAEVPAVAIGHGNEAILVVEDDEDVRRYSTETLRELGYRVVEAADGAQALRRLEAEPRILMLFTDIGLPGDLNGRQLAEEARRRRPDLKVLFTTGYTRNAIFHQGRLDPGVEVLIKPFTYAGLAAKIRQVIGENRLTAANE